jgi:hypothetical protein
MMSVRNVKPVAIWKVCEFLEDEYVNRVMAPDEATVERWQSDSLAHLREGYRIREIQNEHRKIVDSALIQWKDCESVVLGIFDGSHDDFAEWFSLLRATMWRDQYVPLHSLGSENNLIYGATELSRRVVTNIGWCRAFGAFLPLSIPEIRPSLAQVGMMMSSIFYLEMIAKERDRNQMKKQVPLDSERFERIDSIWRRAKELC